MSWQIRAVPFSVQYSDFSLLLFRCTPKMKLVDWPVVESTPDRLLVL